VTNDQCKGFNYPILLETVKNMYKDT